MAKITIVLHDLRGGGAEKMMVRLANQLVENGDEVDMILITAGGPNKAFLRESVNLTELDCKRTLDAFGPLRHALKKSKPDGILAALTHINVITAIVCFSLGWLRKLSVSERNAFSLDKKVNSNKVMKAAYLLAPYIYRLLPNPVIAVSKGVAKDLVDTTVVREKDVVTAPNPVITTDTIESAKAAAKHPWLINKQTKVIVSVGRLSYQKGFDILIDAFYRIHNMVDARLVILGEGELRPELERQIESVGLTDRVSLAGYCDNPLAEVKQADLYVLSSRFEGSPNALVEAMSVETAVIAFDCPHGPTEILNGGKLAPLLEDKNVHQLALAIANELITESATDKKSTYLEAVERFTSLNSAKRYRQLILGKLA
ncbi:MAG: glycosyltransferase [Paraglaciecola sp.]|uniref:glycosyltransferase n=1 Tax=Paraglaciecola sp. TaxID=1920173 RepID=UPI00273DADAD|nr:glycosyltransferase [Paraglaciecola sp.]MDP5030050.1 glycosyltransferase [Paraglaciecola sp.]MDP5131035.1 glycosyltransferase [Paraglaciecola sp.]